MMFSTKKRPRKEAWKTLQSELDEREKLEEENAVKHKKLDKLKARVCIDEEPSPEARHAYLDFEIGRRMGRDPLLTRGRLIVELFDDIMPRTVETFVDLLNSDNEPTYRGSQVSKIYPGFHLVAGDRDLRMEGVSSHTRENVYSRVEQEANWSLPHLNPGVLSLRDLRSSRFQITFRKAEELDGWHAVFGKVVYGFDVLKAISDEGNTDGMPKQPVVVTGGGAIEKGVHPKEFLKGMVKPDDPEEHGYKKRVMRYSSTYRHTGVIGH
jgi:cyclophilin family peptidyl-prolyl cis-trans isomerase